MAGVLHQIAAVRGAINDLMAEVTEDPIQTHIANPAITSDAERLQWLEIARTAAVALVAVAVWFRLREPLPAISLIGVAGLAIGSWPIFREAFESLIARRMTMELSMSIAIVAAAAISEFFTALVITFFVLVAEVLEHMTVSRGRRAIRDLLDFLPCGLGAPGRWREGGGC